MSRRNKLKLLVGLAVLIGVFFAAVSVGKTQVVHDYTYDRAPEIKSEELKIVRLPAQPKVSASVATGEAVIREVSAYNVGVVAQNDDTPCIPANGENICEAVRQGYKRCAANFVPLGTRLRIEGYGECLVVDRMNSRYKSRVDIAMAADQIAEARQWGVRKLKVEILK